MLALVLVVVLVVVVLVFLVVLRRALGNFDSLRKQGGYL